MKTLIIVRSPCEKDPRHIVEREGDLARAIRSDWQNLHDTGPTEFIVGSEGKSLQTIYAIKSLLTTNKLYHEELFDGEYRSRMIQERTFHILGERFRDNDTLIVCASGVMAHYCLDYADACMHAGKYHEFIAPGEAILCLEGTGTSKIIPRNRPMLRMVS